MSALSRGAAEGKPTRDRPATTCETVAIEATSGRGQASANACGDRAFSDEAGHWASLVAGDIAPTIARWKFPLC